MKSFWSVLSVVAVANLLALLALVGWLAASDRLNLDRMRAIRAALAPTITFERAKQREEQKAAGEEAVLAIKRAKMGAPPVTAAERLNLRLEQSAMDRQRSDRVRKEIEDLRRALLLERERLDRDIETFRTEKAAFDAERARVAGGVGEEQFQKTLTTLEGLKPAKAKVALREVLDAGGIEQVVSYLDGMQDRTRTRVIDEFIKDDAKLAADLLERLRSRGVEGDPNRDESRLGTPPRGSVSPPG